MKNFWNNYVVSFFTKYVDFEAAGKWVLSIIPKLIGGLLILVIGWWLAGVIAGIVVRGMERAKVDQGVREFLYSCVKIVIKIMVIITALSTLGMNVTTLIAALGTAGVAIGLALKDSLSNFASGVLILFNHTFKVGDFIEIDGQKGTVRRIELMFTTLATADNKRLVIPNSVLTSDMIINYTAKNTRRLELNVGVAYGSDILAVKKAITAALKSCSNVSWEKEPIIGIASFDDSAITFDIKVWVKTSAFIESQYIINENILAELDKAGIVIPFNQLDVHMIDSKA
ncbi:MAG: mechanosensitive ion channel [Clostridia bacterium]|jgi:small conductance mechanosensitive channel|nr:mechanosensitive ion channel [Clostridia bacterium]